MIFSIKIFDESFIEFYDKNPKIFSEETKIGIDILKNENFFPPLDKNLDRKKWKSYAPVRLLPESKAEVCF